MGGRKANENFKKLNYTLMRVKKKHKALCNICLKMLANTSASRLRSHRNICHGNLSTSIQTLETENIFIKSEFREAENSRPTNQEVENLERQNAFNTESGDNNKIPQIATSSSNEFEVYNNWEPYYVQSDESLPTSSSSFQISSTTKKRKINISPSVSKRNTSNAEFTDTLSKTEEDILNESLSNFIFGANLPISTVESVYFKNFIKQLRPAYFEKLPGKQELSTTLLDSSYENIINNSKKSVGEESILLIDRWNTKSVGVIQCSDGQQVYLNSWDFSLESETEEKQADIIYEAINLGKSIYDTNIYAVVSDNISNMLKIDLSQHAIWFNNCFCQAINLLAKDILNKEFIDNFNSVLIDFNQANLENQIVASGGCKIQLPCETKWCSYRNSFVNFLKNLPFINQIPQIQKKLKNTTINLIFDNGFVHEIKIYINLLNPICEIFDKCQNCSIADAVNLWLDLTLPDLYKNEFEHRKSMILNIYALTAYYLHPHYDNNKLDSSNNSAVNLFLIQTLDNTGIEEWDSFRNKSNLFKILYEKNIRDPLVFWNTAEFKYPQLSKLALKLLRIPASSAQIEKSLSNCSLTHTSMNNRLSFERSKKLMHIYYNLKLKSPINDFEDDDN